MNPEIASRKSRSSEGNRIFKEIKNRLKTSTVKLCIIVGCLTVAAVGLTVAIALFMRIYRKTRIEKTIRKRIREIFLIKSARKDPEIEETEEALIEKDQIFRSVKDDGSVYVKIEEDIEKEDYTNPKVDGESGMKESTIAEDNSHIGETRANKQVEKVEDGQLGSNELTGMDQPKTEIDQLEQSEQNQAEIDKSEKSQLKEGEMEEIDSEEMPKPLKLSKLPKIMEILKESELHRPLEPENPEIVRPFYPSKVGADRKDEYTILDDAKLDKFKFQHFLSSSNPREKIHLELIREMKKFAKVGEEKIFFMDLIKSRENRRSHQESEIDRKDKALSDLKNMLSQSLKLKNQGLRDQMKDLNDRIRAKRDSIKMLRRKEEKGNFANKKVERREPVSSKSLEQMAKHRTMEEMEKDLVDEQVDYDKAEAVIADLNRRIKNILSSPGMFLVYDIEMLKYIRDEIKSTLESSDLENRDTLEKAFNKLIAKLRKKEKITKPPSSFSVAEETLTEEEKEKVEEENEELTRKLEQETKELEALTRQIEGIVRELKEEKFSKI